MICTACANGRHCMSETCACQHRIPEKTLHEKQEVAQGSDKISGPPLDLLPPGPMNVSCPHCASGRNEECLDRAGQPVMPHLSRIRAAEFGELAARSPYMVRDVDNLTAPIEASYGAPIEAEPVSLPPTDDTDWPGGPVPQTERVLLASEPHTGDPDEDEAITSFYGDAVSEWPEVYYDGPGVAEAREAAHQADVRKLLADARIAESELCLSTYTHALGQPPFRCEMHFGHTGPHRSSDGVAPFQWINTSGFTDYGAADFTGQAE